MLVYHRFWSQKSTPSPQKKVQTKYMLFCFEMFTIVSTMEQTQNLK